MNALQSNALAQRCEQYAKTSWEWISKSEALQCQSTFPDRYEATSFGRRKVRVWRVQHASGFWRALSSFLK